MTDWSEAGVEGGLPEYARVVEFLEHGGVGDGLTDNSDALQALIDSLTVDTVIALGEGAFKFARGIDFPAGIHNHGVVLRGAGPEKTTLVFETSVSEYRGQLNVFGHDTDTESTVSNTRSRDIELVDPSGFSVGDDVVLYQDNDFEVMATAHVKVEDPDFQNEALRTWAREATGQLFRIERIHGNTATADREIRLDFEWPNRRLKKIVLRAGVGVEDLTVDNRTDLDLLFSIRFTRSANCWIRNVRSVRAVRYHVSIDGSRNVTVRDSWFYDGFRFGGGGHGYGVVVEKHTSDCLIINNAFQRLRHAMMAKVGANGNVFAYNYAFEGKQDEAPVAKDISIHGHYPFRNLFEGNVVEFIHCSDYWGPAGPGNTFFRNRATRMFIRIDDRSHGQNLIANELTAGGRESSVQIDGTVFDTYQLANLSPRTLPQDLDNIRHLDLPASLWTEHRPDFWPDDLPWPALGPPNHPGKHRIPAQFRVEEETDTE